MIAASPNWRSRSISNTRMREQCARSAARFVESTVLPVPPFGENTVTTRPRGTSGSPWAPDRPPVSCALRIANEIVSGSCGRTRTSSTPAVNAVSTSPETAPGRAARSEPAYEAGSRRRPSRAWPRRVPVAARREQHGVDVAHAEVRHRIPYLGCPGDDLEPAVGLSSASCRSDSLSNVPETTTRRVSLRLPVANVVTCCLRRARWRTCRRARLSSAS